MKIFVIIFYLKCFLRLALLKLRYRKNSLSIPFSTKMDWHSRIWIKRGSIRLSKNVSFKSKRKWYHAGMPFPATLYVDGKSALIDIGDNTRINGAYIHAQREIRIGANTVIAAGVNILDADGHISKSANRTSGRDIPGKVHIGNNVWIGINAIILKNTYIGDHSVISAGSVVKGRFPPHSFIIGNPARKEFILQ